MAFDESLAAGIRDALARQRGVEVKKMFGGVGFLLNGNMLVGVWKATLIVRLGTDNYEDALLEPHVREFDITGKPMRGWVLVEPEGVEDDDQLKDWIERARKFVQWVARWNDLVDCEIVPVCTSKEAAAGHETRSSGRGG
jgi:TfoX/Sxy family transcriptional regulator of competence genes